MTVRRFWARCLELLRRRRRERELQAELASHLEMHVAEGRRAGLTAAEARRQALLQLGGWDQAVEACCDQRGWPVLEAWARDLRYAIRRLRQAPGFAAVVVLTLALGIGVNSAVFSLLYAALLRPLPFPDANRLVWVAADYPPQQVFGIEAVSPDQIRAWQPQLQHLFRQYAWVSRGGSGAMMRVNGVAMEPNLRRASGNLFGMLGVRPQLGRLIVPADTVAGHGQVVVLSDQFWHRAYGGDPNVVGKPIVPRFGAPYTIIGVLSAGFHLEMSTDLWLPAVVPPYRSAYRQYHLLGQRRPGVSVAGVQAQLAALARQNPVKEDHPGPANAWVLRAVPLREVLSGGWQQPLWLLMAGVGCLLLLACVNIANLLLARGRQRQPELALRLALGGTRRRLLQQLLAESGLLALLGGVLGWMAAVAGLRLLTGAGLELLPASLRPALQMLGARGLDPVVVGFVALLTLGTLLGVALAPALRSIGWGLRGRMEAGRRTGRASHLLVAAEVALATLLVIGAGLLVHSFARLVATDPGFQTHGRISVEVEMPILLCPRRPCTPETVVTTPYLQRLLARLRALPGIQSVAGASDVPLADPELAGFPAPGAIPRVFPNIVTSGYFATLGIPILEGRDFDAGDTSGKPKKIIVNQAFVRAFLPGQGPIGRTVDVARCEAGLNGNPQNGCTIIGVVADQRDLSLAVPPRPAAWVAFSQDATPGITCILNTDRPLESIPPELQHVLRTLPPVAGQQPPFIVPPQSLDNTLALSIAAPRFRAWLGALLAGLALLLAAVGIYGVASHAVSRRRHEIGVRMALGAGVPEIGRWVLAGSLLWTLAGAALGVVAGLTVTRVLSSLLYQTPTWDPLTMLAAPLLLAAVAAIATWGPARRAMQVDPAAMLRAE